MSEPIEFVPAIAVSTELDRQIVSEALMWQTLRLLEMSRQCRCERPDCGYVLRALRASELAEKVVRDDFAALMAQLQADSPEG